MDTCIHSQLKRLCGVCRRAKQVGKGSYSSLSGLGVGSGRAGQDGGLVTVPSLWWSELGREGTQ